MSKSQRLTQQQMRQINELLFQLHELRHNPAQLFGHLAAGAATVADCTSGIAGEIADWGPDLKYFVRNINVGGPEVDRLSQSVALLWSQVGHAGDPSFTEGIKIPGDLIVTVRRRFADEQKIRKHYPTFRQVCHELGYRDHALSWFRLRHRRDVIALAVHRWDRQRASVTERQLRSLHFLMHELRWLHHSGRLDPVHPELTHLTPRLRQMLRAVLAGHTPKQIASHFGISVHTVRDHIKRLYAELGVRGREALAAKFVRFE